MTVLSTPLTIGITVTFMFHSFSSSEARSWYLSHALLSFSFTLCRSRTTKSINRQILFFVLLIVTRAGLLTEIRLSVCISKSQRSLCVSFSKTNSWLCKCHFFVWSKLNFLHNYQWITYLTLSCLVLYPLCATLLHSLIMCFIIIIIVVIVYSLRVFQISVS